MKQEQNLSESRAGFPSKAQERRREKRHIGALEGRADYEEGRRPGRKRTLGCVNKGSAEGG